MGSYLLPHRMAAQDLMVGLQVAMADASMLMHIKENAL
jgi:hypothetical protein